MSAGAFIYAFAFLYDRTGEPVWLGRAKLLDRYYWDRRNPQTDLFAERPNAGTDRFDGSHFVTCDTGLYCHALLKTYELTGKTVFKDHALAYLKAYRKYGYDAATGSSGDHFSLTAGPCPARGWRTTWPRARPSTTRSSSPAVTSTIGSLIGGYEFPIAPAEVYGFAAALTDDPVMLDTAKLFADSIAVNLPPRACLKQSWYRGYAEQLPQGTYAGLYGQTISFFIQMHVLSGDPRYLRFVHRRRRTTRSRGCFTTGCSSATRAKRYYANPDGVGYLLYALVELDQVDRVRGKF